MWRANRTCRAWPACSTRTTNVCTAWPSACLQTVKRHKTLVQEAFVRAAAAGRRMPAAPDGEEAWLVRVLINLSRATPRDRQAC